MKGSQIQVCHSYEIANYKERILQVVCLRSLTAFGQFWGLGFFFMPNTSFLMLLYILSNPLTGCLVIAEWL